MRDWEAVVTNHSIGACLFWVICTLPFETSGTASCGSTGKPTITMYVMKPEHEISWQAVAPEIENQQEVRRRVRGKTSIRSLETETSDETPDHKRQHQMKCAQVLEEEMMKLPGDDIDLITLEPPVLESLKKASVIQGAEEEILQTKIIGQDEVKRDWTLWIDAAEEEVNSLLHEKGAFRELDTIQVEELVRKARNLGQKVEFIPSKLVFTKKPAEKGLRRKVRWVVRGIFEAPSDHEQTYCGGADITALRIMIVFAVQFQWRGSTLDIKTAFLNANFDMEQGEDRSSCEASTVFHWSRLDEQGQAIPSSKGHLWFPSKPSVVGTLQGSTSDWFWDWVLHLLPLQSEPNLLWKMVERDQSPWVEDVPLQGLLLTYVDDIFTVAEDEVRKKVLEKIMETWKTSPADLVGEKPMKFLGMNISKVFDAEIMKGVWYVNQDSYIRVLLENWWTIQANPDFPWSSSYGTGTSRNYHPWKGEAGPATCWGTSMASYT